LEDLDVWRKGIRLGIPKVTSPARRVRIGAWQGARGSTANYESAARITDRVVSRCFSRDAWNYSAAGDNARPFRHVLVLDLIYASAFEMSRKPQNRHGVSAGD